MESIINPYREICSSITPKEFEVFCAESLKAMATEKNLERFTVLSDQHITASDGTYQIDISFEFYAANIRITGIVECKKYSRPIERKVVAELYTKINSLGVNKGVIMSTSGFQTGAVDFAKSHGITLLQIVDRWILTIQNSVSPKKAELEKIKQMYYELLPKYAVLKWDLDYDIPFDTVYPTKTITNGIHDSLKEFINKTQRLGE